MRDTNALKTLKEKLDREGASAIIGTEYSYTISDDKIYANKLNATEKYTGTSRNKIVSKAITEDLSDTPQGAELKILLGKDLCNVGYIIGKDKIVLYVKIPPQNLLQDTKTIREKDVTYTIFLSQQEKWVVVHITGLPLPVQPTEPNQSEPITQERNLLLPLNSTEHTHENTILKQKKNTPIYEDASLKQENDSVMDNRDYFQQEINFMTDKDNSIEQEKWAHIHQKSNSVMEKAKRIEKSF